MKTTSTKIKAVIVDDELLARENLKLLLAEFCPDVDIVGEAGGVKQALEVILDKQPEVVFLDIRMPSGSEGFELLDAIPDKKFQVIFVTAFKDYAIKAFNANAIHYILKPIDIEELIAAVQKVIATKTKIDQNPSELNDYLKKLASLSNELRNDKSSKISISHSKGIKIIDISTIMYLEADGNCTKLFFNDGTSYLDTRTLKKYEEILNSDNFVRIHKSSIINLNYLSNYSNENGHFAVMNNGTHISISRAKLNDFIKILKSI